LINKKLWIPVFLGMLVTLAVSGCVSYSEGLQKALIRTFGHDFPHYTFRGTPIGNFGVGTMYLNEIEKPNMPIQERWQIGNPNTWFDTKVSQEEKDTLLKKIIPEGNMASVSLTEAISQNVGLEASVPVLRDLLSLGASVSLEKGVKVTLTASKVINHQMNWSEFESAIEEGKINQKVAEHVQKHDFIIAADDLVLIGYKATISVDKKINPELNAKLTGAVGTVLGKDTQLKVNFSSSHSGTFEAEAQEPVVAAILFKAPPPPSMSLSSVNKGGWSWGSKGSTALSEWRTVIIDIKVLKPLEELLSRK